MHDGNDIIALVCLIVFALAIAITSFVSYTKGYERAMREGINKGYTQYIVDKETTSGDLNWIPIKEACDEH